MTPAILLDVDGVLNALGVQYDRGTQRWPDYVTANVVEHFAGRSFPITYSPTLIAALNQLHGSGMVEFQWLTTWGSDANNDLAAQLGILFQFPVAGEERDAPLGGMYGGKRAEWWKLTVAKKFVAENSGRPVLWVDDDFPYYRPALEWASAVPGVEVLQPNANIGLSPDNLLAIQRWAVEASD